ncbi:hypothetical protein [Paracoccus sp. DMF]|nr:hypothetical protein [Paracoccus sp. DMF]MCV2448482.1 hypothetical protein [Paracoccus sp. DMF]
MSVLWHLLGRFYEARSIRAHAAHIRLKKKAEKFFRKISGSRR